MQLATSQVIAERLDLLKAPTYRAIPEILSAIREDLGMDVAFLSQFRDRRRFFRYVVKEDPSLPIEADASDPLEETYCQRIVDGRLPKLIKNAADIPAALQLPITTALPVGAHLSVPVVLRNGHIFGTFCTFKRLPDYTLQIRDLGLIRIFAEFSAQQIDRDFDHLRTNNRMEICRYIGWRSSKQRHYPH